MSIEQRIIEEMKTSMKEKNQLKLEVLRSVKSQMKYYQIEKKLEKLSDQEVIEVISKLVKQRKDSIEQFRNAGRLDLVEKEESELGVLEGYLPKQLSDEELKSIVEETIRETGATEKKQMGVVMKALMPKVKGKADGKRVNEIVNEKLSC